MALEPDIRFTTSDELHVALAVEAKSLLAVTGPSTTALAKSHYWITPKYGPMMAVSWLRAPLRSRGGIESLLAVALIAFLLTLADAHKE